MSQHRRRRCWKTRARKLARRLQTVYDLGRPASANGETDKAVRGLVLHLCTCCAQGRSPSGVQNCRWKRRSSFNSLAGECLPSTKSLNTRRSQSNCRRQWLSQERFSLEELQAASRFAQYRCDEHRRSLQLGARTGRWYPGRLV